MACDDVPGADLSKRRLLRQRISAGLWDIGSGSGSRSADRAVMESHLHRSARATRLASNCGTESTSNRVYGCAGRRSTTSAGPSSHCLPRYITNTRSLTCSTARWVTDEEQAEAEFSLSACQHGWGSGAGPAQTHPTRRAISSQTSDGRLEHERSSDADPLALTAGELVWASIGDDVVVEFHHPQGVDGLGCSTRRSGRGVSSGFGRPSATRVGAHWPPWVER